MKNLFFDNPLLLGLLLGVLFGFALYYAGATNRIVISKMLKLQDLTLMKIIIFAIGFSMFLLYSSITLNIIPIEHFSIKTMNYGVVLGSGILAVGFGMVGLCPGTAVASLGAGYFKSIYLILGGIIGAFVFTLCYPILKSIGLFENVLGGKTTLVYIAEKYNYLYEGTPLIGVFLGIVIIIISLVIPYSISKK